MGNLEASLKVALSSAVENRLNALGLNIETARRVITDLLASLPDGERVSRATAFAERVAQIPEGLHVQRELIERIFQASEGNQSGAEHEDAGLSVREVDQLGTKSQRLFILDTIQGIEFKNKIPFHEEEWPKDEAARRSRCLINAWGAVLDLLCKEGSSDSPLSPRIQGLLTSIVEEAVDRRGDSQAYDSNLLTEAVLLLKKYGLLHS